MENSIILQPTRTIKTARDVELVVVEDKVLYEVPPPIKPKVKTPTLIIQKTMPKSYRLRPRRQQQHARSIRTVTPVESILLSPDNETVDSLVFPESAVSTRKQLFQVKESPLVKPKQPVSMPYYCSLPLALLFLSLAFILFQFLFYGLLSYTVIKEQVVVKYIPCSSTSTSTTTTTSTVKIDTTTTTTIETTTSTTLEPTTTIKPEKYLVKCEKQSDCETSKGLSCPKSPPVGETIKYCECRSGYVWDSDDEICGKSKTINEKCSNNNQCDSSESLICDVGTCKCPLNGNWFWSESSKRCVECPEDWVVFSDHCYYVNLTPLNWEDAEKYCQSQGGNLMKIDNDEEYNLTYSFYEQYAKSGHLWVGGYSTVLMKFKWSVDDSEFDAGGPWWCDVEPNNFGGTDNIVEGCVFMWVRLSFP